jgi:hypothetical protein
MIKQNPTGGCHEKNCVILKWNPAISSYNMSRFLSLLEDNIPGFDWHGGHSGVVLGDEQAAVLKRLFDKYLRDNAAIFTDRLALIEKRSMDNDQLYIDEELLTEIQGR